MRKPAIKLELACIKTWYSNAGWSVMLENAIGNKDFRIGNFYNETRCTKNIME